MSDINEFDQQLIDDLRRHNQDLLCKFPEFDTDYNILRFIKGYGPDHAPYWFRRHLKTRKAFHIDRNIDQTLPDDDVMKYHYPSGLLGPTGKDNKLVLIETVGKTDVGNLLKSIQATEFFRYRMKYMEKVNRAIQEQERLTNRQSGVIYIFDLDGIVMDPFLIPALNGPYLTLWRMIGINYPEWIHKILVVNVPSFFGLLWKAFVAFLPENTSKKVRVMSGNWKKDILEYIHPDYLPVHWGGNLVDEHGDPMCRSRIIVPQGKIPPSLFSKNVGRFKELPDNQVQIRSAPAGGTVVVSYLVPESGITLKWYVNCQITHSFALFFAQDPDETDLLKMDEVVPQVEVPGGLAPDYYYHLCEKPGAYHIQLGNPKAWFFSVTIKFKFTWVDPDGKPANVEPLNRDTK